MKKHQVLNFASDFIFIIEPILIKYAGQKAKVKASDKRIDLVTAADIEIEKLFREKLKESFPTHNILGEEFGFTDNGSDYTWVIDPVDGTINYAYSNPNFGVSIAFQNKEETIAGFIYHPTYRNLYYSYKGDNAFRNSKPLKKLSELDDTLEGKIYSGGLIGTNIQKLYKEFGLVFRSTGSAIIDLMYLATGKAHVVYFKNVYEWDIAAALSICEFVGVKYKKVKSKDIDYCYTLTAYHPSLEKSIQNFTDNVDL